MIIAGIKLAANDTNQGKHQFIDVVGTKVIVFFCISCFVGLINLFFGYAAELETEEWHGSADRP